MRPPLMRTGAMQTACLGIASLMWAGFSAASDSASELHVPSEVQAGQAFHIQTQGNGEATFYLLGPAKAAKQSIHLGEDIAIDSREISSAGSYHAILCSSEGCVHQNFEVRAGAPARLSFFLHPSRVPVSAPDAIHATAFLFDRYYNPVFNSAKVGFEIATKTGDFTKDVSSTHGVAWMQMPSSSKEDAVRITASVGDAKETRVIQQVAGEACGLHIKDVPDKYGMVFETEPVRDCDGNPVPDGTIVSFTKIDSGGMTTVDAPIKKGIATAHMEVKGSAHVSVACGVVLGNELSIVGRM